MSFGDPPPTDLIQRFALLVDRIKQAITDGTARDRDRLGPLGVLLWNYLGRTLLRLAALRAHVAAGTLPVRGPARREGGRAGRATASSPAVCPSRPRIPTGPVFARYQAAHLSAVLERIVAEPEMQALLEAAPQAGRLLRPLWRKLTNDPMPEALRLPPRPKRSRLSVPDAAQGQPVPTERRRPWARVPWARPPMRIKPPPIPIVDGPPLLPDW